jgi:integrase/recombinase XerD
MSGLRQVLADYLELRRGLGYKLARAGQLLPDFVDSVERSKGRFITTVGAVAWATGPAEAAPSWHGRRLGVVRVFAKYARALDRRHEVPPSDLLPWRAVRRSPYLYSTADVRALMKAAKDLRGLRPHTYATLIGLLSCTGMRIGEAIGLDVSDVDLAEGVLTVRFGKFGKSREVPVQSSTRSALEAYAKRRDRFYRGRSKASSFFVSLAGTRLNYIHVQHTFSHLVEKAGLGDSRPRPRLHDFRHSFATSTLAAWHRAKTDVEARLPTLSTYLGHVGPSSTYWYLSTSPELMRLAARRLEHTLGDLP